MEPRAEQEINEVTLPFLLGLRLSVDVARFPSHSLELFSLPPKTGRIFGFGYQNCRAAIFNEAAAEALFGGKTVGRTVRGPENLPSEIMGILAVRKAEHAGKSRPTIYYYNADQPGSSTDRIAAARFRVPVAAELARAEFDANVVSPSYFDTMGFSLVEGRELTGNPIFASGRVGVVNQQAADLHFGGKAVGAAIIDNRGRRTGIIGVMHSPPLGTFQRRVEPAVYFPMAQDLIPRKRMTLILGTPGVSDAFLAKVRDAMEAVRGRVSGAVIVRTLDTYLSQTALAPLRIATTIITASATLALSLGMIGLLGALTETARQRRRDLAYEPRLEHRVRTLCGGCFEKADGWLWPER